MRVLVACEYSGIVRDAFRRYGHDAWSCDLVVSNRVGPHIVGDVLSILNDGWDLMIAHPPCTYLANSGAQHIYKAGRWEKMLEAIEFFKKLMYCAIPKIAIENPIMHGVAKERLFEQTQVIQPWQYGHPESKATCLWLKNLSTLRPTKIVTHQGNKSNDVEPFKKDRGKVRAKTYLGIADAMALQWGHNYFEYGRSFPKFTL